MAARTYFTMVRAPEEAALAYFMDIVSFVEVLWVGVGDSVIEPTRKIQPRSKRVWHLMAVLQTKGDDSLLHSKAASSKHLQAFMTMEVDPQTFQMQKQQEAKHYSTQILNTHLFQLLTLPNLVRNVSRAISIYLWALYHIFWAWDIHKPFQMVNLLKFRETEDLYEVYRTAAGKGLISQGGSCAFIGKMKGAWDEVLIVAYTSRLQFLKMVLLTPSYWLLIILRDEALADSMLHAASPV